MVLVNLDGYSFGELLRICQIHQSFLPPPFALYGVILVIRKYQFLSTLHTYMILLSCKLMLASKALVRAVCNQWTGPLDWITGLAHFFILQVAKIIL